jgi:hypothetical protein
MDTDTELALGGDLYSNWSGPPESSITYQFTNSLGIPTLLFIIEADGEHSGWDLLTGDMVAGQAGYSINPGASVTVRSWHKGEIALFLTARSGGFVAVYEFPGVNDPVPSDNQAVNVDASWLVAPNNMGVPPSANASIGIVIPADGPRVLTGCGRTPSGSTLTREQYWHRMPDSYCLAPGESRTISLTTTTGLEATSSEQSTVATALGISASAGWGPISASVSASLSTNSTVFHEVNTTTQSTVYFQRTVNNQDRSTSALVLLWQLIDIITIFDSSGRPTASFASGQQPVIASAVSDPNQQPSWPTPLATRPKDRRYGVASILVRPAASANAGPKG